MYAYEPIRGWLGIETQCVCGHEIESMLRSLVKESFFHLEGGLLKVLSTPLRYYGWEECCMHADSHLNHLVKDIYSHNHVCFELI